MILLCSLPTDASRALPDFVELDLGQSNTENISLDDVKALQSLYREHCEVRQSAFIFNVSHTHTAHWALKLMSQRKRVRILFHAKRWLSNPFQCYHLH